MVNPSSFIKTVRFPKLFLQQLLELDGDNYGDNTKIFSVKDFDLSDVKDIFSEEYQLVKATLNDIGSEKIQVIEHGKYEKSSMYDHMELTFRVGPTFYSTWYTISPYALGARPFHSSGNLIHCAEVKPYEKKSVQYEYVYEYEPS